MIIFIFIFNEDHFLPHGPTSTLKLFAFGLSGLEAFSRELAVLFMLGCWIAKGVLDCLLCVEGPLGCLGWKHLKLRQLAVSHILLCC